MHPRRRFPKKRAGCPGEDSSYEWSNPSRGNFSRLGSTAFWSNSSTKVTVLSKWGCRANPPVPASWLLGSAWGQPPAYCAESNRETPPCPVPAADGVCHPRPGRRVAILDNYDRVSHI